MSPDFKEYKHYKPDGTFYNEPVEIQAALDPILGRITFSDDKPVDEVLVSYTYGFGGDIGGGPYDRRNAASAELTREITWRAGVSKNIVPGTGPFFNNLTEALKDWDQQEPGSAGLITIMDNRTYSEDQVIRIPEGSQLVILAADWPFRKVDENGVIVYKRFLSDWTADDLRPHLSGNVEIAGTDSIVGTSSGNELIINGLLIEGSVSVKRASNLEMLIISHCTCVPQQNSLSVNELNDKLTIILRRTICGSIDLNTSLLGLTVNECIIDAGTELAVGAVTTPVKFIKSTVFGSMTARETHAENCIFTGRLSITRQQQGCIRFSYVAYESKTPRRYRCQPDLEITTRVSAAGPLHKISKIARNKITRQVLAWLVPSFTSDVYGDPGYGQLGRLIPDQIRTGADNESEMGVFNFLKQPQREANLLIALREYLPLGLESGVIHVT
ncbi:MAG: hypothetical protein WCL00_12425 [Bacteroidota bacterium]